MIFVILSEAKDLAFAKAAFFEASARPFASLRTTEGQVAI
jgi:hypothetical protein